MADDNSVEIRINGKKHSVPIIISPKAIEGADAHILAVFEHPKRENSVLVLRRADIPEGSAPLSKYFMIEANLKDGKIVEKTGGSFFCNIPARAMTREHNDNLTVYDFKVTDENPKQKKPENFKRLGIGTTLREVLIARAKELKKESISFPGGKNHNAEMQEQRGLKTKKFSNGELISAQAKLADLDYSLHPALRKFNEKVPNVLWTAGKIRRPKK